MKRVVGVNLIKALELFSSPRSGFMGSCPAVVCRGETRISPVTTKVARTDYWLSKFTALLARENIRRIVRHIFPSIETRLALNIKNLH